MSLLSLHDVGARTGKKILLDGVSVNVGQGELLGLIGPNGAGKSTLLKVLARLQPGSGDIRLNGTRLDDFSARQRGRMLAYLGQGDQVSWPLTVADFVALGRVPHQRGIGWQRRLRHADRLAVDAAINATHLHELRDRRLDQMSGGERARARLARALAVQAPVLLADEPVAALDPFHQLSLMELMRRQCDSGTSMLVVLHDLTLASRFCHRVLLLDQGRMVAVGDTRSVLTAKNLQQVYRVRAMQGEHQQQAYVVPWACHQELNDRKAILA